MKTPLYFLIFLFTCFSLFGQESSRAIVENMFASIDKVQTLRFKLKKAERVDGVMKDGEQDVKFNRSPKKIYTYIHKPNAGVELLWIDGVRDNKAYINPNGFPYVNVTLDPYGSNMRKGNHHTVHEVGFDYIGLIIKKIYTQTNGRNDIFINKGIVKFDGRECYQLVIDYKPFKYVDYVVKRGETLVDIAYNNHISDYMILEKNPEIKDYNNVKEGQKISIPNAYAQKTILFIDKETFLPVVQKMYDDKGLYEQYEFYDLKLNTPIAKEEFSVGYKDYNF